MMITSHSIWSIVLIIVDYSQTIMVCVCELLRVKGFCSVFCRIWITSDQYNKSGITNLCETLRIIACRTDRIQQSKRFSLYKRITLCRTIFNDRSTAGSLWDYLYERYHSFLSGIICMNDTNVGTNFFSLEVCHL